MADAQHKPQKNKKRKRFGGEIQEEKVGSKHESKKEKKKKRQKHGGAKVEFSREEKEQLHAESNAKTGIEEIEEIEESKTQSGLSHLQQKMKSKLTSAQFRWLNEQLYSTTSTDAVRLFQDKSLFSIVSI